MADSIIYMMLSIGGLLTFYVLINLATRADRQVKNQRAMIDLLEKLCKKNGISDDELQGVRNYRDLK